MTEKYLFRSQYSADIARSQLVDKFLRHDFVPEKISCSEIEQLIFLFLFLLMVFGSVSLATSVDSAEAYYEYVAGKGILATFI